MESLGRWLRREREQRQISLEEVSQLTRIPLRTLENLENDRMESLAGDIYIRGYLKAYARAIGLDPAPWLRRLQEEDEGAVTPAPFAVISAPERGRRFGIAITIVILIILFTLALSIVLKPRDRGRQNELSQHPIPCLNEPDLPTPFC
jgi:cytoskeletal protein RodZ